MTSPTPSLTITSPPAPSEEFLKTDTLGRVRTSRARRAAILDEFERSGGSGAQFAALLGIKYPTFASWIQQRRRERADASPTTPALRWVEAVVETPPAASSTVRIHLPGGAVVELHEAGQAPLVAELLRHLTGKGQ